MDRGAATIDVHGNVANLPRLMPWEVAEKPRKVRSATDWSEEYDPVRAILAESARSARMLKPVRIGDVVEFLRAEGRSILIAGPRLFIMDGQSANWAGIVDEIGRAHV